MYKSRGVVQSEPLDSSTLGGARCKECHRFYRLKNIRLNKLLLSCYKKGPEISIYPHLFLWKVFNHAFTTPFSCLAPLGPILLDLRMHLKPRHSINATMMAPKMAMVTMAPMTPPTAGETEEFDCCAGVVEHKPELFPQTVHQVC